MRMKLIALAGLVLALAACETVPEDAAESAGGGAVAGPAEAAAVAGGPSPRAESEELAAVEPTLPIREMFVQEVGDRVFFDFDRYVVRPDGEETLRRQAEFLKRHPEITAIVEGRGDERGTREYNLALGDRRANAVKSYLVSLGVAANRIRTVSYGKERPVVLGHDEGAWAQNRVAVTVIEG